MLWFASNLLFLHYESHPVSYSPLLAIGCDLLRIYYFCTTNHIITFPSKSLMMVVICFEFIIFALRITSRLLTAWRMSLLWFASNLLFLHYESHQFGYLHWIGLCCDLLRIYYFCTTNHIELGMRSYLSLSCDLLRIYYFCTTNHIRYGMSDVPYLVVICFEFIIFALRITSDNLVEILSALLWFASNLLFLHYESHRYYFSGRCLCGCDLLRIYYFCTTNHITIVVLFWYIVIYMEE